MSKFLNHQREESPLRKNFDSFTSKQKLQDAQEEFSQALYLYRIAEDEGSPELYALKRNLNLCEQKINHLLFHIYSGFPAEDEYAGELVKQDLDRCPAPAWNQERRIPSSHNV